MSLIDVINTLRGRNIDTVPIKALLDAVELIIDLASLGDTGQIDLGSFDFGGLDLRNSLAGNTNFAALAQGLSGNIIGFLPDSIGEALDPTHSLMGFTFPLLTDNTSLIKLLLGADFDLIKLDLPAIDIEVDFDLPSFGPIWPLPPVYIVLTGDLSLQLNLDFGFDTTGLREFQTSGNEVDILGGLYVVPGDIATFSARVGAGALVGVDAVIFEVGARLTGGITGELTLVLEDPNTDGKNDNKFHISEFDEASLDCLFEVEGAIFLDVTLEIIVPDTDSILDWFADLIEDAIDFVGDLAHAIDPTGGDIIDFLENGVEHLTDPFIDAGRDVLEGIQDAGEAFGVNPLELAKTIAKTIVFPPSGFIEEAIEEGGKIPIIPKIKLFSFTHDDCDPNQKQPALAELEADGDLILNIGDRADKRGLQEGEINEVYTLTALAPGIIRIDAFGISQIYGTAGGVTVKNVIGNAGSGNDTIKVAGRTEQLGSSAAITFNLTGGEGDDWLEGNFGNDLLIGNAGSDTIIAREGDDRVFMHDQASQGTGGLSELADGGAGNDHIYGGANDDRLAGGEGDDLIFGGDGNDIIRGEGGIDTIYGLNGGDEIGGGAANDNIYGGVGSDVLVGNDGKDNIFGDIDAAITDAAGLALYGTGNTIQNAAWNDLVVGDNVRTALADPDFAGDIAFQDLRLRLLLAEFHLGGSPDASGDDGDHIETNSGDDLVLAGGGNDFVVTADGNDRAYGGGGNDEIRLGNGNDVAFGGIGDDLIFGEADNDNIEGGNDADILFGDFGEVLRDGGGVITIIRATDLNDAAGGADVVRGGSGADIIIGGVNGSTAGARDQLSGDSGDDILIGDLGQLTYNSDASPDLDKIETTSPTLGGGDDISGGLDADIAFGGKSDDLLLGDDPLGGAIAVTGGNDILLGDNGEILYFSPAVVRTTQASTGGADTIRGNRGNDVILGGANSTGRDKLSGDEGEDIILCDNGVVAYNEDSASNPDLDRVETADFGSGGADDISGGADRDFVLGGDGADLILGDDPLGGGASSASGNDILIGDQGRILLVNNLVTTIETTDGAIGDGAADEIHGNGGADVALGGVGADKVFGDGGNDILLGDEGDVVFNLAGPGRDGNPATADRIRTTKFALGSDDQIFGGADNDIALGGTGADLLVGDNSEAGATPEAGGLQSGVDILIGDQGQILLANNAVGSIETTDLVAADGAADEIHGNGGADVALGGVAADKIFGEGGKDILLGDEGEVIFNLAGLAGDGNATTVDRISTTNFALGAGDEIYGGADSDIALGGTGADLIAGDNSAAGATPEAGGLQSGRDILIGDQGEISLFNAGGTGASAFAGSNVTEIRTTDVANGDGGIDTIAGNGGNDIIVGGVLGDILMGAGETPVALAAGVSDDDIILGDEGRIAFNLTGPQGALDAEGTADGNAETLDLIETTMPMLGAADRIHGDDGSDIALGGAGDDTIFGDLYRNSGATLLSAPNPGSDMLFGDGGRIRFQAGSLALIRSTDESLGGSDLIEGNEFGDVIVGGAYGDKLWGESANLSLMAPDGAGADIILGDNGELSWILANDTVRGRPDVSLVTLDAGTATLDRIMTMSPTNGGQDEIRGNGAADIILGGTDSDTIWGDTSDAGPGPDGPDGNDLIFGDNGKLYPTLAMTAAQGTTFYNNFFFSIQSAAADGGRGDVVFGNGGDDIAIGGQGDDLLFGGIGNDDLIGGHNISGELGAPFGEFAHDDLDGLDLKALEALQAEIAAAANGAASLGNDLAKLNPADIHELSELLDGGAGDDALLGDNGIVIRKGANFFTGLGDADAASPRFRTVGADGLYAPVTTDLGGLLAANGAPGIALGTEANVTPEFRNNLDMAVVRAITILDQSLGVATSAAANPTAARPFGNDIIVGGADDDEAFGGLGDDIIQGDGRFVLLSPQQAVLPVGAVLTPQQAPSFNARTITAVGIGTVTARIEVVESATDGNDYIEGNGGNDRIYGNLGADDLIGGSSNLFGSDTRNLRIDGADLIFGGAGNQLLLARNAEATASSLIDPDQRHAADADVIVGDNGNIYRIVDAGGAPERFVHDDAALDGYSGAKAIAVRAVQLIDYGYAYTGSAPNERLTFSGVGAGDLVYGESGDDIIYGATGDDVLFGNSGDDDIIGGHGADFVLGGTGIDGILGDDGAIKTARVPFPVSGVSSIIAEPLYGITFNSADINRVISSPPDFLSERINLSGTLVKSVELAAFRVDDLERNVGTVLGTSFDDIIFGGLGGDFIHGGDGDDAISGAEALPYYYAATGTTFTAVNDFIVVQQNIGTKTNPVEQPKPFWYSFAPYNPGHVLDYQGNYDGTSATSTKIAEFAYYNELAPRRTIKLDPVTGAALLNSTATARDFLLNFNVNEGPQDTRWLSAAAGSAARATDGDDRIFGDLGNDWIVGGTGRDHTYGGYGDDLINMDDDPTSPTVNVNGKPGKFPAGSLENNSADDYQSYADIAYGGAGRDFMVLNSGFDRAVDWTGEFNSFVVPFSPFGEPSITRQLNPYVERFLLDLSKADGADQGMPDGKLFIDKERATPTTNPPDPTRNYEPYAELGMVRPTDGDWTDQHGAPTDPQAGNQPGVLRDVRERAIEAAPAAPVAAPLAATASSSSITASTIDWSAEYFVKKTTSKSIAADLPTFILVQSQLSGAGTGQLPGT